VSKCRYNHRHCVYVFSLPVFSAVPSFYIRENTNNICTVDAGLQLRTKREFSHAIIGRLVTDFAHILGE